MISSIEVYGYGSGEIDQLGLGENVLDAKRPKKVFPNEKFPNVKINKVVCGAMHTIVLSNMGVLYSWGCNDDKALGREGADNFPEVIELPVVVNNIAAGDSHSVAYSTDLNKVFTWGSYRTIDGKFGNPIEKPTELNKRYWSGLVEKVICGSNHTIMLSSGYVYTWGNPEFGQIGRMPSDRRLEKDSLNPLKLTVTKAFNIYTGSNHSFLITDCIKRGEKKTILKSWGFNNFTQLGHSGCENSHQVKEIEFFRGMDIQQVAGGDSHSIVLLKNGDIYVWGRNDENQLGFSDNSLVLDKPTLLENIYFKKNNEHVKAAKCNNADENYSKNSYNIDKDKKKDINTYNKISLIQSSNNYCYAGDLYNQKFYSWGFGENYVLSNLKESENETTPYLINNEFFYKSYYKENSLESNENNKPFISNICLGNQHVMVGMMKNNPFDSIEKQNHKNAISDINDFIKFDYNLEPYLNKTQLRKLEKERSYLLYRSQKLKTYNKTTVDIKSELASIKELE